LKDVLGGVRIVGLGEATHGTREFFRLKHRLLEFLVTEPGFTVLAMEASASAAPAVDADVRHGTGDGARALAGLGFWTWRTGEALAMLDWMRAYDRAAPRSARCASPASTPSGAAPPPPLRCGAPQRRLRRAVEGVPRRRARLHLGADRTDHDNCHARAMHSRRKSHDRQHYVTNQLRSSLGA
jgi:hypothetical protein